MNKKLGHFLDIAKVVLPPIGALIDNDDGEQMANDVADIVESVIGHLTQNQQKKAVQEDPALRYELKIKIEEVANRQVEAENRTFENERNDELQAKRRELAREQLDHEEELQDFQKTLENTEAARAHANKAASSEHWWVSGINPLLSIIIVIAFFVFIALIALNPIGEKVFVNADNDVVSAENIRFSEDGSLQDANGGRIVERVTGNNLEVFYIAFGAMATAFVTVVGFHFGSSYGSKRKTELQRLYGTRGVLSGGQGSVAAESRADTSSRRSATIPAADAAVISGGGEANLHPFERFWMENLSHIEHFNWRELLEKGASNTGIGLNTDPPIELFKNVVPLVNVLEQIRKELDAPVKLLSVYRSSSYNRHVGGATSSRHMQFDAADFCVLGDGVGTSSRWSAVAKRLRSTGAFKGGIGIYSTFVHLDTRGSNANWDER